MTMQALDTLAAQAVLQARLLERAVHDPGPWSVAMGDRQVPAQRFRTDSGVTFLADFPSGTGGETAVLRCGDDLMGVRPVSAAADEPFTIRWDINARLVNAAL